MYSTMNICIIVDIDIINCVNHTLGFLGGSPVIEIDQLPVINAFAQQWKISPYFVNILQANKFSHILPYNWRNATVHP